MPCNLPSIDAQKLKSWSSLSYPDLAFQVMRMFISSEEIPDQSLKNICYESFVKGFGEGDDDGASNSTHAGSSSDTIPVKKIGSSYMVELFHGPTFCFKDFG